MGYYYRAVLRCAWTKHTKPGERIGLSGLHKKFVSEFGYLAAFSNAGGLKLSDVENDAKFRTL